MNRISCLLVATGQASRVQGRNTLLLDFGGKTLVRTTAMEVLRINFEEMVVVTGYESDMVSAELRDLPLKIVHNSDYGNGMHSSIRTALQSFRKYCDGFIIGLSDQPLLDRDLLRKMIAAFQAHAGKMIVVPTFEGMQGETILIPREFIPEILSREDGDHGCAYLLEQYPQRVVTVEIDTIEDSSMETVAQQRW